MYPDSPSTFAPSAPSHETPFHLGTERIDRDSPPENRRESDSRSGIPPATKNEAAEREGHVDPEVIQKFAPFAKHQHTHISCGKDINRIIVANVRRRHAKSREQPLVTLVVHNPAVRRKLVHGYQNDLCARPHRCLILFSFIWVAFLSCVMMRVSCDMGVLEVVKDGR